VAHTIASVPTLKLRAAIPVEVERRAAELTPQSFGATEEDVATPREVYGDEEYGATLAEHLRGCGGRSQLARHPRYARFFVEAATESEFQLRVTDFLRRYRRDCSC